MIWDAIVVGGSFAGLSAAMQLARGQRQVLLIDAGEPRNRFAAQSHGFFAADGAEPGELRGRAWQQLMAYPTVQFRQSRVNSAEKLAGGHFSLGDETGMHYQGKALILATGLTDTLPTIPGLAQRWGKSVIHCPYCHGYEFRQQPIAVIATGEASAHQAAILPDWGPVTYFSQGQFMPDAEQLALLQRRGVTLEHTAVTAVEGEGLDVSHMLLADGRRVPAKVVYVAPKTAFGHTLAQQLGCELEQGPLGAYIKTDAMQHSSIAGLFAAGDMASAMHNGMLAAAAGVKAGAAAHRLLMLG
ncbi:NAD(P)/FAD-dependent oxidoreductase [Rheinheimera sp. NSM]|uniref:NAD(P)/FAD-dependent oxidoreductase n=1 Tax=Rheinheimera sp. NSM TaxID=3457884 RepID=UPI00403638B2